MLNIVERTDEKLVTLTHGANVFHEALAMVREGETHFHVTDENKTVPDYDLVYTHNMMLFPEQARGMILKMTQGSPILAPFLTYNEDADLCIDFLKQFKRIEIECTDEYSIVVARIALKYTDIPVYYLDEKLLWFLDDNEKLIKAEAFPEKDRNVLRVTQNAFDIGYTKRD